MDWNEPTGKVSTKVVHLQRWTTFLGWSGSVKMDSSIQPFQPILNPRTSLFGIFHGQNGGKYLSLHFLWIVTSRSTGVTPTSIHVQLPQVCGCFTSKVYVLAADGSLKMINFPREFGMFFSSFDSNVVFEVIWHISRNGLLKITRYTS